VQNSFALTTDKKRSTSIDRVEFQASPARSRIFFHRSGCDPLSDPGGWDDYDNSVFSRRPLN
jgi:hypothetical protein